MFKPFIIIFFLFSVSGFGQTLSLDQNYIVNYNFDLGKYTFGLIENQNKSVFCYGDFGVFSNLNLRNGILIDSTGNVSSGFIIAPTLNQPIIYARKTNFGYFLHTAGDGFRKIDEVGNEFIPGFQQNIISELPSSLLNYCLESYPYLDGRTLAGCYPDPCSYPAVNPSNSFYLYRLTTEGHYDTTFNHNTNGPIQYIKSFGDSVLYISGSFSTYDNHSVLNVVKIDNDGIIDTSFQSIFSAGNIYPAFGQPDGKIIFTGSFLIQGTFDTLGIVRVNSDGSLDQTFNNAGLIISQFNGFGYLTAAHSICPTTDGGYLIGGRFNSYQNNLRGSIVKTDQDGFIDLSLLNGTGIDSSPFPVLGIPPAVTGIVYGNNDKYYISGFFNGFNGQTVKPLIRLEGLLTSTNEIEVDDEFQIYPNPSSGYIYFSQFVTEQNCDVEVLISDCHGITRIHNQLDQVKNYIDISNLSNGLYVVKVISKNHAFIRKFQVIR